MSTDPTHHQVSSRPVFMPSTVCVFSFSVSIRTTLANAVPSQSKQARGASWAMCSFGQIFARNSSRLVYSFTSVSPGLKEGIKCQGKLWVPAGRLPVDPSPSGIPDLSHFRCTCTVSLATVSRSSATNVQLIAVPWIPSKPAMQKWIEVEWLG